MRQRKLVMSPILLSSGERVNSIKIAHLKSSFTANSGFLTRQFISQYLNCIGGQLEKVKQKNCECLISDCGEKRMVISSHVSPTTDKG